MIRCDTAYKEKGNKFSCSPNLKEAFILKTWNCYLNHVCTVNPELSQTNTSHEDKGNNYKTGLFYRRT